MNQQQKEQLAKDIEFIQMNINQGWEQIDRDFEANRSDYSIVDGMVVRVTARKLVVLVNSFDQLLAALNNATKSE